MRFPSRLLPISALTFLVTFMHLTPRPLQAQERKKMLEKTVFSEAEVKWDSDKQLPVDIKPDDSAPLNREDFLLNLRRVFELPSQLQFIAEKENLDPHGVKHIRYRQYYQGLELARTRYIMHLKDNRVVHAHGPLIKDPGVELLPSLSSEEAFHYACSHLGMSPEEARKNAVMISRLSFHSDTRTESGKLMLSQGSGNKKSEHFRLVYHFDIVTTDPLQRFDLEVDAHNGELIGKYPTLYHENIPTRGYSLYNDMVDIVISDTVFKSEWPDNKAFWHPDMWNAYPGTDSSWWMADTANFNPGGYDNNWHVVLETDAIELTGTGLQLVFYHRYAMEDPDGASDYNSNYDGWDGINVRISPDGGNTWEVLTGPVPAYTCSSLWSFGEIHGEGPGIPGWAGSRAAWSPVNFNLSDYRGMTVKVRFEFASDAGYSTLDDTSLFGWQIDEIVVRNSDGILFSNPGNSSNMHPFSASNWVGSIDGKYRLRETTRGYGIATINAENGLGFTNYVDFVQDTFPVTGENNRVGVGIHWASELSYDYFMQNFGRNSYDDQGSAIISYADWVEDDDPNNAFWAGSFAAYGAGDGEVRGSYGSIDVVGHEITHGVTDHSSGLIYQGESGALNESFSDIFGVSVEFFAEGRDQGDWLVGEDVYKGFGAIRSMKNPKVLSCPDTYLGEYWFNPLDTEDNGGVHTNSGVQNYWFYLLAEGGSGINDDGVSYQVNGIGLDNASAIAYSNLTNYLLPDSRYMDAASYSIQAASELFGGNSQEVQSVKSAWEAAGIYMDSRLFTSDTLLQFESAIDESDSEFLILRNKGIESLGISEFRLSDPDHFTLQNPPATPLQIDGGDSLRLRILFSPGDEGPYDDSLFIESSDPEHPLQTIHLSGLVSNAATGLSENPAGKTGIELSVTPNPFRDRLLISYLLPHPDHITIQILDMSGKLLYQSSRDAMGKETMEIIWNDMQEESQTDTGGIYLLTVRTSKHLAVKKIVRQ